MRPPALLLAVALLAASVGTAHAAWSVDAAGVCVERWTPSDMLNGPTAVLNGPILPFRQMAGGAVYAWNTEEWWPWQIAVMLPAVTAFSTAAGALEGAWWISSGLADTLTGGAFGLAPEGATELSVAPQVSAMLADASQKPAPTTDPCGRPLGPP
jgi:hypothetical protein